MKKILSLVLALITLTCLIIPANAATLAELKDMYPDGSYWYDSFDGSIECTGFARMLCYLYYGSEYYINNNGKWSKITDVSYIDNGLKPGDLVRYRYNGHSVWVVAVNDDTVDVADCNWGSYCIVHWKTMKKSDLKYGFTHAYSAPYALTENSENQVKLYETAVVTAKSGLKIRSAADINSTAVGYLASGSSVSVYGMPIKDANGYTWRLLTGNRGWVCDAYLSITSGKKYISGTYKIKNSNGKYVSYTSIPQYDTNIVMYDDLSATDISDWQLWNFEPMFYYNNGRVVYRITPVLDSGYSLDCDATNNEILHLYETLSISAQYWVLEVREDGSLRFLNDATGYALDICRGSNDNNAEVITYPSHDQDNQKFYLVEP